MSDAGFVPERGDFVWIVLDPRTGREQSGARPALVLTPRRFNELTGYAFVAPVTGTRRGWPFEVPIPPGGRVEGVVLADQTRSIDFAARHTRFLAHAPSGLVDQVLERVGVILEPSERP
jgi:mRNA interferase MazF